MTNDTKQENESRADFYQLMAVMLRLPTEEMAEGVHQHNVMNSFDELADEMSLSQEAHTAIKHALINEGDETTSVTLRELREEYTDLFTHPESPRVHLFESQFLFWKDYPNARFDQAPRMFVSSAALDAERRYQKAGLARSSKRNEPADHMATELEFMALLHDRKAELIEAESWQEVRAIDVAMNEFIHFHFLKWGVDFFESCALQAKQAVYRMIGEVGAAFMKDMLRAHELSQAS